jgi:hypothetical protein
MTRPALALLTLVAAGCAAPQPVLAPSPRLQEEGPAAGKRAVRECLALADRTAPMSGAERVARESAAGAGRMAGATRLPGGAVIEGPARPTTSAPLASPAWRAVVERCLTERGYAVQRWE